MADKDLELEEIIDVQQEDNASKEETIVTIYRLYKKCLAVVKKYKFIFIAILLGFILYSIYKIQNREPEYTAKVVFTLYDEAGSQAQGSNALQLTTFNLSSLVSNSIDIFKLQDIAFSQKVISKLMFSKCVVRGKEDFFINHYYAIVFRSNARFKSYNGLSNLNRQEYKMYNIIENQIPKISKLSFTDGRSYFITVKTSDEELTKVLSELYYQSLSNFYIEKATEKAYRTYIFLKGRLDSISNTLYSTEFDIANFEDHSNNLLLYTARVPQNRQIRNSEITNAVYLETLKNFETARVTLNNVTPLFQILARPYYPLSLTTKTAKSIVLFNFVVYLVITILTFLLFYIYYYYYDIIKAAINKARKQINEEQSESLQEQYDELDTYDYS